jgi:hypothetical protein
VPLARDLHPEFGYVGSAPRLFRKLGLIISFVVFGLVAGVSGVAVFMTGPDPDPMYADPMHAMALAPAEALISAAAPAGTKADAAFARTTPKGGAIKPRSVQALNERPAIAAVAIGHGDGPAVLPSEPAVPVAALAQTPDDSAMPADAADPAPAVTDPPATSPKKARTRSNHVQHRDRNEYSPSRSSSYYQSGYARVW